MAGDDEELRAQLAEQERLIADLLAAGARAPGAGGAEAAEADADERLARELQAQEEGAVLADEEYARRIQESELELSRRLEAEMRARSEEEPWMVDNVWGALRVGPDGRGPPRPHQLLCFALCPCCVGGLCTDQKIEVYYRIIKSFSWMFAVVQICLLFASLFLGGLAPTTENPMIGPPAHTLSELGAKNTAQIVYRGQVWRLVTPMFLHAGFIHIFFNLLLQLRISIFLELEWGRFRWLAVYIFSGVFSALGSCLCLPDAVGVGASGALMGLFGAWSVQLLLMWSVGTAADQNQRGFQLVTVFVSTLIMLSFSFVPFIDWAAHLFGLIGGAIIAVPLFAGDLDSEPSYRMRMRYGGILGAVLAVSIALIVLFTSIDPKRALLDI